MTTATKAKTKSKPSLAEMRAQLDAPPTEGRADPFAGRPKAAELPDELVEPFWRVIVIADRRAANQAALAAHPGMRQAAIDADATAAMDAALNGSRVDRPGQHSADHAEEGRRLEHERDALQSAYDAAVTEARAAVAYGLDPSPAEGVATGYVHRVISQGVVVEQRERVLEALAMLLEADRALVAPRRLANWYARAAWPQGSGGVGTNASDLLGLLGEVEFRKGRDYSREIMSPNSQVLGVLLDLEHVAEAVRAYIAPLANMAVAR